MVAGSSCLPWPAPAWAAIARRSKPLRCLSNRLPPAHRLPRCRSGRWSRRAGSRTMRRWSMSLFGLSTRDPAPTPHCWWRHPLAHSLLCAPWLRAPPFSLRRLMRRPRRRWPRATRGRLKLVKTPQAARAPVAPACVAAPPPVPKARSVATRAATPAGPPVSLAARCSAAPSRHSVSPAGPTRAMSAKFAATRAVVFVRSRAEPALSSAAPGCKCR